MQLSQSLLDQVCTLANEAGKHLARFYQQDVTIQTKSDNTPVTEADLFVSQFLIEKLTALFPDIPVLSEENCNIPFEQRQTWQTYWLIDPLDGTQQFIDRTDQFSVLITLVQNHQPVLGVVHFPILNITYYAMKGFGAFKQSNKEIIRLQPRKIDLTKPLKIAVGATTSQKKVQSILKTFCQLNWKRKKLSLRDADIHLKLICLLVKVFYNFSLKIMPIIALTSIC